MTTSENLNALPDDEQHTIEASFALLEICLEQLSEVAPVNTSDQILNLVPEASESAQRLILVELVKFDLARARESGLERTLEFYWPTVGSILPQENIPCDLVLEEVQLRKAAGESPRWADYRQRFPDLADTIGKWLAGGETEAVDTSTSSVPQLPVGEVFDDFEVQKLLGQGAFARVYLARQVSMHRLVALKATSRGSEEPQALSQLDHANIVRVYDQREVVDPPTILLYMQYLAGGTLADCIKHVRALPPENWSGSHVLESIDRNLLSASQTVPEQSAVRNQIERMSWAEVVAWVGIQLAEGLSYASEKGVLHRDVKPANILLSAEAIPKLADFNVSSSGLSGRAGAAAYFGGSLAYMSPEQLCVADPTDDKHAEELDGQSDLYALGIVLWELWQGRRPWMLTGVSSSWSEAVVMQQELRKQDFAPLSPSATAAERVLENSLRKLLEADPAKRPASGKEAAARLRLAFYPELANRFEPAPKSVAGRLLSIPVLLVSLLLIFGPNTAASLFNLNYNDLRFRTQYQQPVGEPASEVALSEDGSPNQRIVSNAAVADVPLGFDLATEPHGQTPTASGGSASPSNESQLETSETLDDEEAAKTPIYRFFGKLADRVNGAVFPLGAVLFLIIILPLAKIVSRAKLGHVAKPEEISYLWTIGNRATVICAVLWAVSGCVFPIAMRIYFPNDFGASDAFHFFISLVLCGGVAWIYPYFGMTLLSLMVYYPKVINPSMADDDFDERCQTVRRHSLRYLVSAALIPLTAIGLLMQSAGVNKDSYVVIGVCITGLGLFVAYGAHCKIEQTIAQYAKIFGKHEETMTV